MSSGEAEFYIIVKGASMGLGMQALVRDLGGKAQVIVLTDATTGKSLASRRGLGKVRHIEVAELWVQQAVRDERIQIRQTKGTFNTADMFTKHLGRQKNRSLCRISRWYVPAWKT